MELTKDKIRRKIILVSLILSIIFLSSVIVNLGYKIKNTDKGEMKISGILIESDDFTDSLIVEIAKDAISPNDKVLDVSETPPEEAKSEETKPVVSSIPTSNGSPYYIKVNYTANTVTIYKLDGNGNYTIPVKAMICSSGKATPRSGVYKTPAKYRWALLNGNVWGQYSTRITKSILFHSVPYLQQSPSSLKASYYDKLGLAVSAGCIRLTTADAKWLYDNCPIGTMVEFYSSSNPGPLGKPTAMKISGYPDYLNHWDPTDPDPNNPWIEYFNPKKPEPQPTPVPEPEPEPTPIITPTPEPTPEDNEEDKNNTIGQNNVTGENNNSVGENNNTTINNATNN